MTRFIPLHLLVFGLLLSCGGSTYNSPSPEQANPQQGPSNETTESNQNEIVINPGYSTQSNGNTNTYQVDENAQNNPTITPDPIPIPEEVQAEPIELQTYDSEEESVDGVFDDFDDDSDEIDVRSGGQVSPMAGGSSGGRSGGRTRSERREERRRTERTEQAEGQSRSRSRSSSRNSSSNNDSPLFLGDRPAPSYGSPPTPTVTLETAEIQTQPEPEIQVEPEPESVLQPIGNTNINLGGSQDFGLFRRRIEENTVPVVGEFDAGGFFAEHHTPLPSPTCGERICLQTMLGVMGNLVTDEPMTILQIGLNSPIEANPENRPPLALALVVDVSGSMDGAGKMEFVRTGLETLIGQLDGDDEISLITYSNEAVTLFPMSNVEENRQQMIQIVRSLTATGGTNLYSGLEMGYLEVMNHYDSGQQNRVVLLSDGQPTSGITANEIILSMSETYNSSGVGLTTIGLGSDFNVSLMRTLAERGDGNFYYVEDAGAVDEVFADEVSYFTVPVAFNLQLQVEMGDMYRIEQAHGSSQWQNTQNGGELQQPSVFLAHRESHADITESGGRRGGGSALILELTPNQNTPDPEITSADIATIHVSFTEPGTNRIVEDTIVVHYPNSPWVIPVTGYFQAENREIIEKSFLMMSMYDAIVRASTLFYQGQRNQAVGVIRRVMAAAYDYNDSVNDATGDRDVELDIVLLQEFLQVMFQNGAAEPVALRIPNDPWPADQDADM